MSRCARSPRPSEPCGADAVKEPAERGISTVGTLEVVVRGAACVLGGLVGLFIGRWLVGPVLTESINLVYLTLLGLLLGYLLSARLVGPAERTVRWFQRLSPDAVLAAGVGATAALVITVLLNSVLEQVPGFSWQVSVLMTTLLVAASSWFFVRNRALLLRVRQSDRLERTSQPKAPLPTVLDTSALIDGRVSAIVDTHFLDGRVLLPQVVLFELQRIADSDDPTRRRRGRRGLEVLAQLEKSLGDDLELVPDTFGAEAVDTKLVKLCLERRARLLTTDYNLARVATVGGVTVLNPNALANALRPGFATGETLRVQITKPGREPGQGLAYLDDGTMVVVEGAGDKVGQKVSAAVTSHLQTQVGQMVFAQLETS